MNPLYSMLFGSKQGQIPLPQGQTVNTPPQDWNAIMGRLQANPAEMIRNAGYQIPESVGNDPQKMVMHLIQSGQVGGAAMQRIQPILNMLGR